MDSGILNLNNILDLEKWQKIQDEMAEVTGMAIITVDYKGIPKTKHSKCTDFCKIVRMHNKMAQYCQRCDSRGGLEAVRLNEPYIYLCHYNIVDVAIPIIVYEKYVGAVMIGQVLIEDENGESKLEKILTEAKETAFTSPTHLYQEYAKLPRFKLERIETIAKMIWHISNYIIIDALSKHSLYKLYTKSLLNNAGATEPQQLSDFDVMGSIKKEITNAITEINLKDLSVKTKRESSPILKPAIDYIYENKHKFVSLNQMAKLCHLSPGYFSRLFKKEFGENFSMYIKIFKVSLAKQLLETTNTSISQISDDLGYSDVGYFIKQFKDLEGVTPAMFRKYIK